MDPQQTTTTPTTSRGDEAMGPKEPTNIVKRKRTSRQRPTILTHSSTSNNAFNSSQTSSSDFWTRSTTTTEDEDTANCLILLSKGDININIPPKNIINNNMDEFIGHKFTSKRYIQTSTDAVNGSNTSNGTYVYECKTCGRTFTSFQALGGHRASHTKPKNNEIEKHKPPSYTTFSDEANNDQSPQFESRKNNYSPSSSLSLQINHKVSFKKSSSKLHECSICGAEFNSGQALGGHMRRHRATNGNGNVNVNGDATNTMLSLIPYSPATSVVADDRDDQKLIMNDGLCLDLDLNLPAPSEKGSVGVFSHDQHERESSFKFTANHINKQQHLSAVPTLVGCHY